jgi:molecular chaperone HtpG
MEVFMAGEFEKEKGSLSVSTENLLPIIKKWLYSEHDIFLRELVSNAHDAILKLKQLKLEGVFNGEEPEYKVMVKADKEKNTLTISDNGLGMDAEEIKKYINQIAFSGAKEFVQKYQKTNDQKTLIGFFGLGFYSAFMVSNEVEIYSKSFKEGSQGVHWKSDGSIQYELEQFAKETHGTDIVLHLLDDSKEFLENFKLKETIKKYSNFLPVPIYLDNEVVNHGHPIWTLSPNEIKEEDDKKFYQELFPHEGEPLFAIHIKTDYPFELRGILYFPRLNHELDASKGNIKLFVNNVFVADKIKEITPEFLGVIMGALDSPDIPLNVSRSQLQGDPRIKKISAHIVKKVGEKLSEICANDREKYKQVWEQVQGFVKYGCITDTTFYEAVKKGILFKTLDGEWITLEDYVEENKERNKNKEGKTLVLYLNEEKDRSSYEHLLSEQGMKALIVNSSIDSHFIDFLEKQNDQIKFARVDSDVNEVFFDELKTIDENKEKLIIEIFKKYLDDSKIQLQMKSFKSQELPALVMQPEGLRRLQEMTSLMMGKKSGMDFSVDQLIINSKSDVILKLPLLDASDSDKCKNLINQIYDIAFISAGKLRGERLTNFVKRSYNFLSQ